MWQKYKNQIIMAVVGAVLTGVIGWLGKVSLDAYTHTKTEYHPEAQQIQKILATVQANEFRLDQMRYNYLVEKSKTAGLDNIEELEMLDLKHKLTGGRQ